jgi:hypothetical protein
MAILFTYLVHVRFGRCYGGGKFSRKKISIGPS